MIYEKNRCIVAKESIIPFTFQKKTQKNGGAEVSMGILSDFETIQFLQWKLFERKSKFIFFFENPSGTHSFKNLCVEPGKGERVGGGSGNTKV